MDKMKAKNEKNFADHQRWIANITAEFPSHFIQETENQKSWKKIICVNIPSMIIFSSRKAGIQWIIWFYFKKQLNYN